MSAHGFLDALSNVYFIECRSAQKTEEIQIQMRKMLDRPSWIFVLASGW